MDIHHSFRGPKRTPRGNFGRSFLIPFTDFAILTRQEPLIVSTGKVGEIGEKERASEKITDLFQ